MIGQCGIQIELNSWVKYEVFGLVVHTPEDVMHVKCKWVFVQKLNEIIKYKVRLTECLKHIIPRGYEMPEAYNHGMPEAYNP